MRLATAALILCLVTRGARSADPAPDVRGSIDRAFGFLAKDAVAWRKKYNCITCHHAALPIWAMREGKARGHAVDGNTLAELTKWVGASGDGSNLMVKLPATARKVKVINLYAVLLALALEAGGGPSGDTRDALKALLTRVKADQTDEGPWQIWPEPGPKQPFFASAEVMSTFATLALLPDAAGKAARDKGLAWLAARTPEDDAQADAIRLILWRRAGRPAEPLVKRILGRQNTDGGWSQTKDMGSDAFATGQALYALMESGLAQDAPAVRKAHAFLTKTQRPDGSWPMTSRPSTKNLVPITCAGTAWATLGLVRSSPARTAAPRPKTETKGTSILQEPVGFRVYQRDPSGRAEIPVVLAPGLEKASVRSAKLTGLPAGAVSQFVDGKLTDVPTGGPYQLSVTINVGDAERKLSVGPIFVGDLWVLAGQSNMQGIGDLIDVTLPHPKVMSLEMDGRWVRAQEPLHWWLIDPSRQKIHPTGAGLGLPFAVTLVEKTNVPIGLLPCAVGGTYMTQWDPSQKDKGRSSLYGAMLDQVNKAGGKVKGMLWYQAEAEHAEATAKVYPKVFAAFIAAVRKDLHQPDLPFYLVQVGRFIAGGNPRGWKAVQETQRLMPEHVHNTAVISVIDLELDDFIHVGTQGLKRAGRRLALIALGKLYGQAEATTPDLSKVVKGPGRTLLVKLKGVNRRKDVEFGLKPARHIAGFSIRRADDTEIPLIFEAAVGSDKDTVVLKLTGEVPRGAQLWYGYGLNPYCNLTDGLDMAVPAFGPSALDGVK